MFWNAKVYKPYAFATECCNGSAFFISHEATGVVTIIKYLSDSGAIKLCTSQVLIMITNDTRSSLQTKNATLRWRVTIPSCVHA